MDVVADVRSQQKHQMPLRLLDISLREEGSGVIRSSRMTTPLSSRSVLCISWENNWGDFLFWTLLEVDAVEDLTHYCVFLKLDPDAPWLEDSWQINEITRSWCHNEWDRATAAVNIWLMRHTEILRTTDLTCQKSWNLDRLLRNLRNWIGNCLASPSINRVVLWDEICPSSKEFLAPKFFVLVGCNLFLLRTVEEREDRNNYCALDI